MDTIKTVRHKKLIELIRAKRVAAGLRQRELARRLGKPQSFISKIEKGQRRIDVVEYLLLAEAIGFDPYNLLAKVAKASAK